MGGCPSWSSCCTACRRSRPPCSRTRTLPSARPALQAASRPARTRSPARRSYCRSGVRPWPCGKTAASCRRRRSGARRPSSPAPKPRSRPSGPMRKRRPPCRSSRRTRQPPAQTSSEAACRACENGLRFVQGTFGEDQELWILLHGLQHTRAAEALQKDPATLCARLLTQATPAAQAATLRTELQRQ